MLCKKNADILRIPLIFMEMTIKMLTSLAKAHFSHFPPKGHKLYRILVR